MNDGVILLVEDNPDDITLTMRALRKSKVRNQVVVVRDGAEALDYFFGESSGSTNGRRPMPRLIVLDLKLPKVDGVEVLQRLRADARTQLIPIVILTTSNEKRDIVNSYRQGANSYIRKPVDFAQFNEAMRQLGDYWLQLNEPLPKGVMI